MPQRGLTLFELLVTLVILSLLLGFALPGFERQIENHRTAALTEELLTAIHTTRTRAISRNRRATLATLGDGWHEGWELFDDANHNGERDAGETLVLRHRPEHPEVEASGNTPVRNYISYVGTGESRFATGTPRGGFQAGTLTICPEEKARGYRLVLARMGRLRQEEVAAATCD